MVDISTHIPGVVVARLEGVNDEGCPLARWDEEMPQPLPVLPIWMDPEPDWSACAEVRCIVGFEDGDRSKPVLLGLLDAPGRFKPKEVVYGSPGSGKDAGEAKEGASASPEMLRIESGKELVLECGQARIHLRADGRVVIQGKYLLSRSKGVNKIKGGSVQIN